MVWIWSGFIAFILLILALDLGVFHKDAHEVKPKEALIWSAIWIALGLSFTAVVYFLYRSHPYGIGQTVDLMSVSAANPLGHNEGPAAAIKYVTGYLIEKSLSVDNIFVIAMVFGMTRVPQKYRHRVLFWGILGALAMRGAMIAVGAALIAKFAWIVYVFGGILILTALKMLFVADGDDPAGSAFIRHARKWLPVTDDFHGEHFFVRGPGGRWMMTPLMLALLVVEFTDLVFAVDSIPAVFAITTDPFIVFTSNVFAILGLRSLYFALEGMIGKFRHLKTALALVLMLVGVKMLAHAPLKALLGDGFNLWVLALVAATLAGGVIASILDPEPVEGAPPTRR